MNHLTSLPLLANQYFAMRHGHKANVATTIVSRLATDVAPAATSAWIVRRSAYFEVLIL